MGSNLPGFISLISYYYWISRSSYEELFFLYFSIVEANAVTWNYEILLSLENMDWKMYIVLYIKISLFIYIMHMSNVYTIYSINL